MTAVADPAAPATDRRPAPGRAPAPLTLVVASALGTAAVLAGTSAISPLIIGHGWIVPVIAVAAVVWLIGVGGRLASVPLAVTMLLQMVGITIAATSLFLTSGVGGIFPGSAALGEAQTMLTAAWDQILTTVPPATATPDLELLIALLVGLLALLTDVLIAGSRTPALVAIPLLGLYSVPASISETMLPWFAFVAPAVCYAGLLAVTSSTVQRRQVRRSAAGIAGGTAIAALAIVGSLLLADSVTGIGTEGRVPRGGHGGDVGVSPWALLRGDLKNSDPVDTLTVRGLEIPAYLRTFSLEKWKAGQGFVLGDVTADHHDVEGDLPGAPAPDNRSVTVTITPQHYRSKYLPIYQDTTSLGELDSTWNYDEGLETIFRSTPVTPGPYSVVANIGPVSDTQLRSEDVQQDRALIDSDGVPPPVVRLARSLAVGHNNPFDVVQAILNYFTDPANGFTYSLSTPPGNSGDSLLDFLTNKQGYCEQYAAAMAIMLRVVGIPARVGIGFTQGEQQRDGSFQVESTNAHAWVEVKFATSGWVSFDPTPPTGGQGGLQGFVPTEGSDGAGDDGTGETSTSAAPSESSSPSTEPSSSETGPTPTQGQLIPDIDSSDEAATSASSSNDVGMWLRRVAVVLAIIVVIAGLAASPAILRATRRRRRLAAAGAGGPGAGQAAWAEIEDSMVDHGLETDPSESARQTANRLARTTHLATSDRGRLRLVVVAAEREWYGSSGHDEGRAVGDADDIASGVLAVRTALRRSHPISWWRLLLPASLARGGR